MSAKYPNNYPSVVLLGDSLTEYAFDEEGNWGGYLSGFLKRKCDVLVRGFGGYTSEFLKLAAKDILKPEFNKNVACLIIFIGANDSWDETDQKFNPSVPVDKYQNNLKEIIDCAVSNGISKDKIIFITPPSIDVESWTVACEQYKKLMPGFKGVSKTPEKTKIYSDAMVNVGKELDITVLNSFELTNKKEHIKKAFKDGLHFSDYGSKLIFNLIKDEVNERVKKFRNTDLENFPTVGVDVDLYEKFRE